MESPTSRSSLRLFILLLCMQTLAIVNLRAQQLQASLKHYSTHDGLASNAVSDIIQDDYGFIWLATWNGLSRFDGYNFYNYRTGNGSHIANMHNRIVSLSSDSQQNIWMRMYDGRVFVLHRNTDTIINPFADISGSDEYRTSNPLTVTSVGDVLVIVDDVGLYKLRMDKGKVKHDFISTGDLKICCMAEGYQNDIWLGTNHGIHRMDVANLTISRKDMFADQNITCLYSNGYNIYAGAESGNIYSFAYGQEAQQLRTGQLPLNAIFVDSHGLLWFSDTRQGVIKLDPRTREEKLFTQTITVPDYGGMGGIFNETGGVLWVRMNHGGYGYYNRQTDAIEFFHNDPLNSWNLSNTVNANLELNEGVVWESTSRRGLEKLDIMKNTITRTKLVPEEGPSAANEIRALYYDKERKLMLMGNKEDCLYITRADSSRIVITHDTSGRSLGRIYGINKDSEGCYWIASKGKGLFRMKPAGVNNYVIDHYGHDDSDPNSLNNDYAYCTVEDKKGNIWIATYGGGVNVMVRDRNGKPVFLHPQNAMKNYPQRSHKKVRTLAIDRDGKVWAGTTDGILIMSLNGDKFSIEQLKASKEQPENILMSNDIVTIAKDRQGEMWVGTNGGGLAHTIGKDSKGNYVFETFGTQNGLPSEEILSLTFDSRGNVWFASDQVICSYDTGKRIFTTFSKLEGVDETMFSEGAAVTLDDDNLIFGTINGFYTIDREKLITTAGSMLKLRITDFFLNDELQSPRFSKTYDYYVPNAQRVELPSHNSAIAFRFASLNYQLQHRVHYQYKLEGYDRVWRNADKSLTASYDGLPTGHYKFLVKCFLLESPEKYDQREIEVEVPYPFLLSKASIWVYMILFSMLTIWLMLWQQRRLDKKERLRRMQSSPGEVEYQDEDEAVFMTHLMEWLEANASNPSLTVTDMIEISTLSSEEYHQRLKLYTGLTPKDLLNDYRMNKALKLLEDTSYSIAEVAINSGFSDPTAFTRLFKQKTGTTPSSYRDEAQKQNSNTSSINSADI